MGKGLGLIVVALVGCSTHVQLAAVPRTASAAERVTAFQQLRPQENIELVETHCHGNACFRRKLLLLGNGVTVREVEDLLPVLPADSISAHSARRIERIGSLQRWVGLGTLAVVAGGIYVLARGVKNDDRSDIKIGAVVTLVGAGGGGFVAFALGDTLAADRTRVLTNYKTDLARGLGVCVDGLAVVACE